MITAKDTGLVLYSYVLGCFVAGYYWTRLRTGKDIRTFGSGNAGASNVGRSLGASGFAVTFLCDFAKGAIAVCTSKHLHAGAITLSICVAAVVAGHIWPFQLRLRGGKGIAVSLGALSIFNTWILLIMVIPFAVGYVFSRKFVLSGMIAYVVAPILMLLAPHRFGVVQAGTAMLVACMVAFAHRANIHSEIGLLRVSKAMPLKSIIESTTDGTQ